jgi:hypothetical protein
VTYTICYRNHALRSGSWKGNYSNIEDARARAKVLAEQSQPFMEYVICEGSAAFPSKELAEETYKGVGRKP